MKYTGIRRRWQNTIPHMQTRACQPMIDGGVNDPYLTFCLRQWPGEHLRIAWRRQRPQPQRMPYWQAALVVAWLALTWVWRSLDPEAK